MTTIHDALAAERGLTDTIIDSLRSDLAAERAEVERLRSWIDRQKPRDVYEATVCPICHRATERYYMRAVETVEPHLDDCPWQEARRER